MAESLIDYFAGADCLLMPPAKGVALADLLRRSRRALGLDPPDVYMKFLSRTDGAVADGLMLYGSQSHRIDGVLLPEIVAINIDRRNYREDLRFMLILGERDDDFVAFDAASGDFCRIDRPSGDRHGRNASLGGLIAALLPNNL